MERAAECIKHEGASGGPCGYADELSAFSGVSGARLQTRWHRLVLKNRVNAEQAARREVRQGRVREAKGAQGGKEFKFDPKKTMILRNARREDALTDTKTGSALARKQKVIRLEWI